MTTDPKPPFPEYCPRCRGHFSFRKPVNGACPWCENDISATTNPKPTTDVVFDVVKARALASDLQCVMYLTDRCDPVDFSAEVRVIFDACDRIEYLQRELRVAASILESLEKQRNSAIKL